MKCDIPISGKHPNCAHSWEEWEEIHKAQSPVVRMMRDLKIFWYQKFVHGVYANLIGYPLSKLKERTYLFFHGVPKPWWEHFFYASTVAVDHLDKMRERGHAFPSSWGCKNCFITDWECACKPAERWKEALGDMAFFHRVAAGKLEERPITYTDRGEEVTYMDSPSFIDLTKEEQHRYRRGKYLYFKFYESLWN